MQTRSSRMNLWSIFWRLLLLVAAGLAALLPILPAGADTGPKPSMSFTFVFDGPAISITGGQQMECQDDQCLSGKPLEEHGPQRFVCTATECHSQGYGYAPYHKLVIEFSDRTRESNVFKKGAFDASYEVKVGADALQVSETSSPLAGGRVCCSSALLALAGVVAAIFKLH